MRAGRPDGDVTRALLWNFFEAVRTRKPVVEDVVFGHHAALACHMANEAYFRRAVVTWDEATKTIKEARAATTPALPYRRERALSPSPFPPFPPVALFAPGRGDADTS